MMSCGQFAAMLDRAAKELPEAVVVATKEVVEAVAIEAKIYIGNYQAGWAPLTYATLHGGRSRSGHPFPGKIQLGYAPPDNPLLRTGIMRATIDTMVEPDGLGAVGVVGSGDKVAKFQEMGTVDMPARPFLGLAASRAGPTIEIVFGGLIPRVLGGGK